MPPYDLLGVDYHVGGFGILSNGGKKSSGYYKIIDTNSNIFEGTNLKVGDKFKVPTVEFDGIHCDKDGNLSDKYKDFKFVKLFAVGDCQYSNNINYTGIICVKKK